VLTGQSAGYRQLDQSERAVLMRQALRRILPSEFLVVPPWNYRAN
jgi:ABC-type oligopeptide transport system substrate-binding subunit